MRASGIPVLGLELDVEAEKVYVFEKQDVGRVVRMIYIRIPVFEPRPANPMAISRPAN